MRNLKAVYIMKYIVSDFKRNYIHIFRNEEMKFQRHKYGSYLLYRCMSYNSHKTVHS